MTQITGLTRGGTPWIPAFITELKEENCIGCGRCYKVCTRNCFELVEREIDDDDDDFDDDASMVMRLLDAMDCIGCQACAKVCPKNCHTHAPAALAS
ncbi:ferredoxin III, nif-specific [Ectothiorhodospira shaposhnikovii]|uniref:ferredoxin III, nif-specific n=1 Tax=Ectothiorhodospira shaposhnikovii TaxID=1054 RepID=UPI001903E919|nr:ferredoxin III, nif-specific [Ectothiorhodospira shaposhnikovii]MBK1674648.1 ferredoxin III, nif-specific [Ectothiorhodospira shaposhnikovii]